MFRLIKTDLICVCVIMCVCVCGCGCVVRLCVHVCDHEAVHDVMLAS